MGEDISSSITFECNSCNFRTKKYGSKWRKHLLEEGHQERAREGVKWMTMKTKGRSVVVFGVRRIPPAAILKYLGDLQLVMGFVFWEERKDLCILTLLSQTFRESLTKQIHILQNERLFFRSLDEIPEAEWISICPFAAVPDEVEIIHNNESGTVDDFNESDEGEISQLEETRIIEIESSVSDSGNGNNGGTMPLWSKNNEEKAPVRIKVEGQNVGQRGFEKRDWRSTAGESMEWESNWDEALLNDSMVSLYNQYLMDPKDWECRLHARKWIQDILSEEFPNCVVIPLGNCSSPMSIHSDNYNCFLDVDGDTNEDSTGEHVIESTTCDWNRDIMSKVEIILENPRYASVIEILHKSKRNRCVLTFRFIDAGKSFVTCSLHPSTSDFRNAQYSRLVEFMCTLDDRVRPLLIIARHWSHHNRLIRKPDKPKATRFHSLAIQMLVVTFLINKKILPSIQDLQLASSSTLLHGNGNVNVAFDTNVRRWKKDANFETIDGIPSARCMLTLALEMFAFYGDSVLEDVIISPYIGEMLSKKSLQEKSTAHRKLFRCKASWESTLFLAATSYPLTIQHLFTLTANVTPHIDYHFSKIFLEQCSFSADLLTSLLNTGSSFRDPADLLANTVPQDFNGNGVSPVSVESVSNGKQGTKRKKSANKKTTDAKKQKNSKFTRLTRSMTASMKANNNYVSFRELPSNSGIP